jgi:Putative zinc- or iron-chelating domain
MTTQQAHALQDIRIERIWIDAAARVGLTVQRTQDAYATTDGSGIIAIGADATLDADDSVAQLVFHELCHALVQGPDNLRVPDWGLDNTSERDLVCEHACLRLQAHLADAQALRPLMTPTTISRAYYTALPVAPLEGADEACALAVRGARWAQEQPWQAALAEALAATAELLRPGRRWAMAEGQHPLGLPPGSTDQRCGACAWRHSSATGPRCRQTAGADGGGHRIDDSYPACARFASALDCQACGACCREGFDQVTVRMREPVVWKQPQMVVRRGHHFSLLRAGNRCAALQQEGARFRCEIYPDRPQACHEVVPGDARCLSARRRVGL